jgi:hypothetical protein
MTNQENETPSCVALLISYIPIRKNCLMAQLSHHKKAHIKHSFATSTIVQNHVMERQTDINHDAWVLLPTKLT